MEMEATLRQLAVTVGALADTVATLQQRGVKAQTVLSEQQEARRRFDQVRADATMVG